MLRLNWLTQNLTQVKNSISDEYGRYVIDAVLVKEYELHVSKSGYETVILTFKPEPIGISPITMVEGEGERTKDELSATEGWSMENAVALATFEGIFTIACALVGVHASFEIKRKSVTEEHKHSVGSGFSAEV